MIRLERVGNENVECLVIAKMKDNSLALIDYGLSLYFIVIKRLAGLLTFQTYCLSASSVFNMKPQLVIHGKNAL